VPEGAEEGSEKEGVTRLRTRRRFALARQIADCGLNRRERREHREGPDSESGFILCVLCVLCGFIFRADCGLWIFEQEETEATEKQTMNCSSLFSLFPPVQKRSFPQLRIADAP
jgi:hypothetical protein